MVGTVQCFLNKESNLRSSSNSAASANPGRGPPRGDGPHTAWITPPHRLLGGFAIYNRSQRRWRLATARLLLALFVPAAVRVEFKRVWNVRAHRSPPVLDNHKQHVVHSCDNRPLGPSCGSPAPVC